MREVLSDSERLAGMLCPTAPLPPLWLFRSSLAADLARQRFGFVVLLPVAGTGVGSEALGCLAELSFADPYSKLTAACPLQAPSCQQFFLGPFSPCLLLVLSWHRGWALPFFCSTPMPSPELCCFVPGSCTCACESEAQLITAGQEHLSQLCFFRTCRGEWVNL